MDIIKLSNTFVNILCVLNVKNKMLSGKIIF